MKGLPINDDVLGTLRGRDCIFVDEVQQKGSTLKFKGKKIPVRDNYKNDDCKHFLIYEYDFVYNVFAVDYELKLDFPKLVCT